MHSYQIIDWGKPLEPRDYPDPKPQGARGGGAGRGLRGLP